MSQPQDQVKEQSQVSVTQGLTMTQIVTAVSGVVLTVAGSISGVEMQQAERMKKAQESIEQLKHENSLVLMKMEELIEQHERMLSRHKHFDNDTTHE